MLDSLLGLASSPVATLTWWGHELLHWLVTMNAWTAGLLVGAFLLDKALAERARASWRLALYAPIGLRLLLPLSWRIPLAHAPRVVTLLTPLPRGVLPPSSTGPVHAPIFTGSAALVVAYVVVALVMIAVRLRAYLSLRRELRSAKVASAQTGSANAPCPVLEHEALGPMVVGTIHPRIVLPSLLLSPEQADVLACVLGHESAHVRRGDPWLVAAIQTLTVAFWPVIPVWFAARRVRSLVEMACDERALEHADASTRHRYGRALIQLAGWRTVKLRPVRAGELHFGSGLQARIGALAGVRHWPRVVQAGLVAIAVSGFAACTSVGSSEETRAHWTAPTHELLSDQDLAICGPLLEPLGASPQAPHAVPVRYRPGPLPDGLPPEMVAFCKSPAVRDFVASRAWLTEARNSLALIMYESAKTYVTAAASGRYDLCPSGAPMPKEMPAADMPGDSPKWPDDWNDGAGWQCLHFGIVEPTWFQYEYVSDGQHATAKARARRTNYRGEVDEVTLSISEEVSGVGPDSFPKIDPDIEETWVRVP